MSFDDTDDNYKETPTKVCPDCEGNDERLSICCGANIDSDHLICYECREHSDIAECETCDGTGIVEIDEDEEAENQADLKHDDI